MGGKCPLELLQMTCASIGRESPKPILESKKRKLESGSVNSAGPGSTASSGGNFSGRQTSRMDGIKNSNLLKDEKKEEALTGIKTESNETSSADEPGVPMSKQPKLTPERKRQSYTPESPMHYATKHQQHAQSVSTRPKSNGSVHTAEHQPLPVMTSTSGTPTVSTSKMSKSSVPITTTSASPLLASASTGMPSNATAGAAGLNAASLLNPSLLQSAELDRYLRHG